MKMFGPKLKYRGSGSKNEINERTYNLQLKEDQALMDT